MKKCFVGLIAVLTFGMVVPPPVHVATKETKENIQEEDHQAALSKSTAHIHEASDEKDQDKRHSASRSIDFRTAAEQCRTKEELIAAFSAYAAKEAKKQGTKKFGQTVSERIGDRYFDEIVPAFTHALAQLNQARDPEWIKNLEVTQSPASGMGERILHVYQADTGRDVMKLHVRRDHPPLEGYWFSFHYHSAADDFQNHHELKRIYWGKNTPPKWRA